MAAQSFWALWLITLDGKNSQWVAVRLVIGIWVRFTHRARASQLHFLALGSLGILKPASSQRLWPACVCF